MKIVHALGVLLFSGLLTNSRGGDDPLAVDSNPTTGGATAFNAPEKLPMPK